MPTKSTTKQTVAEWLSTATQILTLSGIESPRLDCLLMLEDVLGKDRSSILAHTEYHLTATEHHDLEAMLDSRSTHTPMAYILGKAEFYGRVFLVNQHVLVPRPETESMIETLLTLIDKPVDSIADVGTGSGAIGITASLELDCKITHLLDVSPAALDVARKNVKRLGAQATCIQTNLLDNQLQSYDVILANLPYVPSGHAINKAASFEPGLAIFGGNDGLDLYRELFAQIAKSTPKTRLVLTESLLFQHEQMTAIANEHGFSLVKTQGLCQAWQPRSLAQQPM